MTSPDERRLHEFKLRIDQQVRHLLNAGYKIDVLGAHIEMHRDGTPWPMKVDFEFDYSQVKEEPNANA